MDFKYTYILKR